MSDFVVHAGVRRPGHFPRHYGASVETIHHRGSTGPEVHLSDGRRGAGTCLGCSEPPCMQKAKDELALPGFLSEFPGDPSLDVCPTDAITWDHDRLIIQVSHDRCVGCGLCVARCPYGAITLHGGAVAQVQSHDADGLIREIDVDAIHPKPARLGSIAEPTAPAAALVPSYIPQIGEQRTMILIRNVLHELGLNVLTRRRGDVNIRVDAVGFTRTERVIVLEVELTDELEAPRQLLEDVAVLHGRYGVAVPEVDLVCVLLRLPNARQEYYRVVQDIKTVVGLTTTAITIGSLLVALWSGVKLNDPGSMSGFTAEVERLHDEPYPGAFSPIK